MSHVHALRARATRPFNRAVSLFRQVRWPPFLNDAKANAPAGPEIDVTEKASLTEKTNHAIHCDRYGAHRKSEARDVEQPGLNEGFHTFAVWWTPEEYVFYVDGRETWRTKAGRPSMAPSYAKLTEEIGPWAGKIADATLPDYFTVDYVRIYDLAKKVTP